VPEGRLRPLPDLSDRDRRATSDVDRSFWTVAAISVVLTVVALELPLALVGFATLVALAVLGAVYIGWAEGRVARYTSDLRRAQSVEELSGRGPRDDVPAPPVAARSSMGGSAPSASRRA